MQVLPAPTHSGPSHVLATLDTVEMEYCAMVGACMCMEYTTPGILQVVPCLSLSIVH